MHFDVELRGEFFVPAIICFVIFLCVIVQIVVHGAQPRPLRVYFFDVGQGDSIFVETPERYQILIDGGRDPTVLYRLGEVMGVLDMHIDLVVPTHTDADHVGGLVWVARRYALGTVLLPDWRDSSVVDAFSESLSEGFQWGSVETAQKLTDGIFLETESGVRVSLFRPSHLGIVESDTNSQSVIARIDYQGVSFLTLGDAPHGVENSFGILCGECVDVDVLKLSHHGSKSSSDLRFLQQVSPQYTVVSAGCKNQYRHPHPDVMARVAKIGAQVYSTCHNGTVLFEVTELGVLSVR